MASQQVPIMSPIKGVVRAVNREGQPPETCWDALNCLSYDRYGRKRLAQRGGLKKQYPNQMSDNFVQGMIEAPNIIYPPGTLLEPLGSITQIIPGPFIFVGPTNVGPLTHTFPTASGTYEWDFIVTFSGVVSGETDPWSAQAIGSVIFYWPLDSGAANNLILFIGASTQQVWSGGGAGPTGIQFQLVTGDPTDEGTWIDLGPGTSYSVAGVAGALTATVSAAAQLIIGPGNNVTLNVPGSNNPMDTEATGLTQTLFPNLGVQNVNIDDTTVVSCVVTGTLSVTD